MTNTTTAPAQPDVQPDVDAIHVKHATAQAHPVITGALLSQHTAHDYIANNLHAMLFGDEIPKPVDVEYTNEYGTTVHLNDSTQLCSTYLQALSPQTQNVYNTHSATHIYNIITGLDVPTTYGVEYTPAYDALCQAQLPVPSTNVIYTYANDVGPALQEYIDAPSDVSAQLCAANIFATFNPQSLVVLCQNTHHMQALLDEISTELSCSQHVLAPEYKHHIGALDPTKPMHGVYLKDSFATEIAHDSPQYDMLRAIFNSTNAHPLHISLRNTWAPTSILFINAETEQMLNPKEAAQLWRDATNYSKHNVAPLQLKTIATFEEMERVLGNEDELKQRQDKHNKHQKRGQVEYSIATAQPNLQEIYRRVAAIHANMRTNTVQQNFKYTTKRSVNVQSRRYSDNPDAPGRYRTKQTHPDIHIYADYSGSMSDENISAAVNLIVGIARRTQSDIYFSSFSHELSQETFIPPKGRSAAHITRAITKLPKVSGGTDFEVIYNNINESPQRQQRLNIIITDFGWSAYGPIKHSPNTIYIPAVGLDWGYAKGYIRSFISSMTSIDPDIPLKCIGAVNIK